MGSYPFVDVSVFGTYMRQPGTSQKILHACEPDIFVEEEMKKESEETLVLWVCRLVGCQKGSDLPTVTHTIDPTVDALIAAISQHYANKKVASGGKPVTLKDVKDGYFAVDEAAKAITCALDNKAAKTKLTFEYADEIEVVNALDVGTMVRVKAGGRVTMVDTLAQEFVDNGVALPPREVAWHGDMFVVRTAEVKAPKQSPSAKEAVSPTRHAFASKANVMLGDALRRKLKRQRSNDTNLASQSQSSGTKKAAK